MRSGWSVGIVVLLLALQPRQSLTAPCTVLLRQHPPAHVRDQAILQRRGRQPERLLRGPRVEHERPRELVAHLFQLADERHGEAEGAHQQVRRHHDAPVPHTGDRRHPGRDLAQRHRRGRRHVPGAAPRAVVTGERDQGAGHVRDVGERVRHVEVGLHHQRALARQQPRHEVLPQVARSDRPRPVEVGRPGLGDAGPPGVLGCEHVGPHPVAHPTLGSGRGERGLLGHRAVDRAVAVQVAHGDQAGPGALRRGEQRRRERRPVGEPLVVGRVGAVVERDGAAGQRGEALGVGGVGRHALDALPVGPGAAAGDDPDGVPGVDQQVRHGATDRARPDDHVLSHLVLLCEQCSLFTSLFSPRASSCQEHCSRLLPLLRFRGTLRP